LIVLNNSIGGLGGRLCTAAYLAARMAPVTLCMFQSCYKTLAWRATPRIDLINDNHYHLFENISMDFD
jgi:hypothetical protein